MKTKSFKLFATRTVVVVLALVSLSATVDGQASPGVKCPLDQTQQCRIRHAVKWRGGEVYFANQASANKFKTVIDRATDSAKQPDPGLILKANHQLVITGQWQQRRCPITGKAFSNTYRLPVAGVDIYLETREALAKLMERKTTFERAKLVFDDKHFDNAFSLAPEKQPVAGANRPVSLVGFSKKTEPNTIKK